ncbi:MULTISPECIES: hypothetical protein [Aphanothece]|uniref:hypothetical protein n=1 Tax=Aphanothece TaxID=1121 RepID=UPI0039853213
MPAKPRLILHIGTEKTGSTSIQQFLAQNRDILAEYNVFTPRSLDSGGGNHAWLPVLADPKAFDEFLCRMRVSDVKKRLASIRNAFISEINRCSSSQSSWIISSEFLQSRLGSKESLLFLRSILGDLFDEITILLYIRRPIETAVSLWSTSLVSGFYVPRLPSPSHPYWNNACNHARTIRLWREYFPEARFIIRLFQKEDFVSGDLISDFKAQIGLPDDALTKDPERQNESLSRFGMLCLCYFNRKFPRLVSGFRSPIHYGFWRFIRQHTSGLPGYIPEPQEYLDYDSSFAESDAWVLHNIFPDREFLWPVTAETAPEASDQPFSLSNSEALLLDMVLELWCLSKAPRPWSDKVLHYPRRIMGFIRRSVLHALKA